MTPPPESRRRSPRQTDQSGSEPATAASRQPNLLVRAWASPLVRGAGGRPGALVEVAGLLLWLVVFTRLHAAAGKDIAAATANAQAVQSAERALHLDIELAANGWLAGNVIASQLSVYVYRLYYAVIIGLLVWVFLRHAGIYRRIRRALVAMTVLVLPVYWAVPLSPPRFALPGIVDVVAAYDILGHASRDLGNGQNHFSAMPSMHVGWSLWCAYAAWSALRSPHPRLALLPWAFPLLMTAIVIGTGNHYVLDVAGSVVLVAVSVAVAAAWGRLADRRHPAGPTPHTRPGAHTDPPAAADPDLRKPVAAAPAAAHTPPDELR